MTWLELAVVLAIHDEQIAEHGGLSGVRDMGLLEAALDRPRNYAAYEGVSDLAHLAAVLGHGLVANHPFTDGNKRTSAHATELFLELNDHVLVAADAEIVEIWPALADGTLDEAGLAVWLGANIKQAGV